MVKKLKVVDVATAGAVEEVKPVEELQPVDDVKDDVSVEEVTPVEEVKEEKEVKEIKEETKTKPLEYINCEVCNKKVLLKTYKYTHQRLCKPKNEPSPPPPPTLPPPPPTPEPKKQRPKRVSKPKEIQEAPVAPPKPVFDGVVSFNDVRPAIDPYLAMKQERVMIRQQRVKSLISQAI